MMITLFKTIKLREKSLPELLFDDSIATIGILDSEHTDPVQ